MAANQIRPVVLIRSGRQNEPVRVPVFPLIQDPLAYTYLTLDTASTAAALQVKSTFGFGTAGPSGDGKNLIIFIGTPGNEGSEIIKTSGTTAAALTSITPLTATSFPHSAGTPIQLILYDQVEFSKASTLTGSKTALATKSIAADALETLYVDTSSGALYEFARYKETVNNTFSDYSDGVINTGYGPLTARKIIDNALSSINKKTSEILSDEFGFSEINNCQMEILRELKRWSFMQEFNKNLGQSTLNGFFVAMPADLDDQNTNKSVYGFRIGKESNMHWVDKEKWNELLEGMAYTTLSTAIALNDVTISVSNSSDFSSSGTVMIGANTYTYTANNKTTNVLTISAATTTNSVGTYAFQGATTGLPEYWTTFGQTLYHYPLIATTYAQISYYADYYKSLTQIVSDADTIVVSDPTVIQYYLAWKFLLKLNNGEETEGSRSQHNSYLIRRETLKRKETAGTSFVLKPRFNDWSRQMNKSFDDSNKRERLGNFPNI